MSAGWMDMGHVPVRFVGGTDVRKKLKKALSALGILFVASEGADEGLVFRDQIEEHAVQGPGFRGALASSHALAIVPMSGMPCSSPAERVSSVES